MSAAMIVAASCLVTLGFAHSILGEQAILKPLFRQDWQVDEPRWAIERVIRFAWHLTSIAWFALAAIAVDVSIPITLAGLGLSSAAIIFFSLRGHLAWPLFALAGLAGLQGAGLLTAGALSIAVVLTLVCVAAIALLHVYWIIGGRWAIAAAIPSDAKGVPAFEPPAWVTGLVVLALSVFGALLVAVWLTEAPVWSRSLLAIATGILAIRAVGDGKLVGFSKQFRGSLFSRWDDRLYTPLAVFMAFGGGAALLS